jgi:hypothetical protein
MYPTPPLTLIENRLICEKCEERGETAGVLFADVMRRVGSKPTRAISLGFMSVDTIIRQKAVEVR